ncbi:hypothetical protein FSP39_003885 [Pinctada imbricata]|uniref:Uncharacterized protein n=1 Tax=Pinctada imbricata TaxID=66713 RepID=A0AA88YUT9_PINIB|nr:hypothetical protein FSP39_003885 [Pinctada imbricata]
MLEVPTFTDSSSTPISSTIGRKRRLARKKVPREGFDMPEGENNNSEEKSDDAKIAGGVVGGVVGVCALGALGLVGYKKGLISPSRLKKFITGNKVDPEKAYPEDVKHDRDDDEPPRKMDCNENKQGSSSSLQTKNETAVDAKSELREESVKIEESSETKYENFTPDRNE